jgi:O-antigen/teichoic acid export membrane protein
MSHQAMGVLCALAGIGTALVILLLFLGQPFVDALFGRLQ